METVALTMAVSGKNQSHFL